jgi:hypothetical protein
MDRTIGLSLAHQLRIVTTLLDPHATRSDRWEAVQPLLDELPDYGDQVLEHLDPMEPHIVGASPMDTENRIESIYEAYGVGRPDGN